MYAPFLKKKLLDGMNVWKGGHNMLQCSREILVPVLPSTTVRVDSDFSDRGREG